MAEAASRHGAKISVIPCGERWKEDGALRPAFEDLIGAGAIIGHLSGSLSPEAQAALAAFRAAEGDLVNSLRECSSGKERIAMGFGANIHPTAEVNVDDCAPILKDGAYVKAEQAVPRDG